MSRSWRSRLILPEISNNEIEFYTKSNLLIAKNYIRVVIGGRGPYIEFDETHIIKSNFGIPNDQLWRFNPMSGWRCYYYEYRSKDEAYIKLYRQKKEVGYADYKIGLFYISPFDLISNRYPVLIRE